MLGACFSLLLISSGTLLILGEAAPSPSSTGTGEEWTMTAADFTPHKAADNDCLGEDALCPQQNYIDICNMNPQLCDDLIDTAKRAQGFSSWGGKRVPFQSWGGKRVPFQSWGGKRVPVPFAPWGGKRVPFSTWGGKRSGGDEENKQVSSWGGKHTFLDDEKRATFNSWGGKRGGFSSWGGKRAEDPIFFNWGGKRSTAEELRDKRAVTVKRNANPRSKMLRLLADSETVAIRRGGGPVVASEKRIRNTVDFYPWGGKRTTQN